MSDSMKKFLTMHNSLAGATSGKATGKQQTSRQKSTTGQSTSGNKKKQKMAEFQAMHNQYKKALSVTGRNDGSDDFVNSFLIDSQNYIRDSADSLNRMNWKDAMDTTRKATRAQVADNMTQRYAQVRTFLAENQAEIDPERYQQLTSYLDDFDADMKSISKAFDDSSKFYAQWENEDQYKATVAQQKRREDLLKYDVEYGVSQIESMQSALDDAQGLQSMIDSYNTDPWMAYTQRERIGMLQSMLDGITSQYGGVDALKEALTQERLDMSEAKRLQTAKRFVDQANSDRDFEVLSQYNADSTDVQYRYINEPEYRKEYLDTVRKATMGDIEITDDFEEAGLTHLSDEEKKIYNYYYAKEGREAAQRYLDSIQETLNARKAHRIYGDLEGNTALEMVFGVEAGLDQWKSGVSNLLNTEGEYKPASARQMASGMIREDLADNGWKLPDALGGASLGQIGYDAVTTTANMAPSILGSALANYVLPGSGAVVGNAMMGASAAGSAYQEALNQGYDTSQARNYATAMGASEVALQYALGGISKLGGVVTNHAIGNALKGVENGVLKAIGKVSGNMASEALEEGIQEVLAPIFSNMFLDTNESVDWEQVTYSALLGFLTAGVLEGPQTVADAVADNRNANADNVNVSVDNVSQNVNNATEYTKNATELASSEKSSVVVSKKENTIQLIPDIESFSQQFGKQSEAVKRNYIEGQDVQEYELGFQTAYAMGREGGNREALEKHVPYLSHSQREIAFNLGAEAAVTEKTALHDEPDNESATIARNQAVQISTGNPVEIVQIESSDGSGNMKLELSDGNIVDAADIQHATDDEAVLYEAVAELGASAETSNTLVNAWKNEPGSVSAEDYAIGMVEAFNYGQHNIPKSQILQNPAVSALTEAQRNTAYEMGRTHGREVVQAQEAEVKSSGADGSSEKISSGRTGKVHFDRQGKTLNAAQETGLKTMEQLSQLFGTEFHVFESYEKDGKRVFQDEDGQERNAPNGWYDPKTGHVYVDLNAGSDGRGTMLFTVAHEMTHFIRDWSPAKFDKLAEAVFQLVYQERDISVIALVREQQAKAARTGREMSFDEAYEEVVADSMESILTSGRVVELMAEVKQQDQTLWQKIRKWFQDLAEDIRKLIKAYEGYKPDSAEGRAVAAMEEMLPAIEGFYIDALQEASANYQAAEGQKNTTHEGGEKYQARRLTDDDLQDYLRAGTRSNKGKLSALKAGQKILLTSASQIKQFIANAIDRKLSTNTTVAYGKVNARLAKDVLEASGGKIKITDNYLELIPDNLQHAYEQHHTAKHAGDIDLERADFENIPEYLDSYTEIVYAIEYASGKVGVCVSKRLSNGRILLIETVSKSRGALQFKNAIGVSENKYQTDYVSVYKKRAGTNTRGSDSSNNSLHDDSNSKISIRNIEPDVKKKFSSRDSNGTELTSAQAEYFRDSKVRDADGNLMVMYHGTPNGGFTKFRSGTYFTQNPEYATLYQNPNASSLSVKRNAENRQNYKVYLNITKPFDTRNQKERRIFMQEYYRKWGTGAPLSDSGLPDWTDGMDLQEFIEEMGYDYDGLILDEGATGGYGEEVKSRGLSYVTFSPEQVKNVDNLNPTDNPDIRYSQRDPLQEKAIKALEKENAQLKEDVAGLKEMVKLQKKLTGGKVMKPSSVENAAGVLKKSADAQGDTKTLTGLLNDFYSYIAKGEELTWEGVKEAAKPAADWLWENRRKATDEYSSEALKDLRTRSISLNDIQKAEAAVTHDSFGNYRKALFGSVKITKDGMPLDEAWHELSSLYPSVFDENMNAADMPRALVDIVSRLNSQREVLTYDEELARQSIIRDVYDSYWNVSTLYTVADVKQKEINALKSKHAQRIEKLRADHREKVEQLHLEQRAAVEAVRAAERYRSQERTQKALDKYRKNQRTVATNRVQRKEKTELRRKIRKAVMELDKLLNRGDKKKNVKDGMSSMVAKSLKLADALFMDEYSNRDMLRNGVSTQMTDAEEAAFREAYDFMQKIENGSALEGKEFNSEIEAMDYLRKLDGQLSGKMAKLKDVFARERKLLYGTTVSDLLGQLVDEYSRLSEAEDGAVRAAKDENVYAHLLQLQKDVGGVTVRDMTLSQLEQVADAYTMVLTTVRNANKMFAMNLKFKRDALAGMVMNEINAAAKTISKLVTPGKNAIDSFSWNNLKPVYAFERLGSETLKTLFGNIRKGQDVWAVDMQEADTFRREQYKKHKRKDWDLEKQHSFEFESGKVELSLEQIMSLYAYSRREQALDHLLKGGFVFSGNTEVVVKKNGIQRRYLKKDATAYNLSAVELMQVVDTLSADQKSFVEDMQTYLSEVMGGKGNEVSMQMYGIKSFGEKNYFPLRSAGQYMEKAKEDSSRKEQGQISIVNSGFTKSVAPKANNPITLDDFMDVWAEHVNDMSMYHGFVLPMEDFRRVYNYSTPNMEEGNSQSVNAVIENAFGKAATNYIDQLYKDLNGGAVSDNRENLFRKLVGLHKKAAVFASASVVIQQPSAFVRAFALVDPKHFIGPKVNRQRHKQLWAEVKKYAPVAFIKEMGYFDTGMGKSAKDYLQAEEYSGIQEKMGALIKDADYRDEVLGKAPALADEMTWCMIWEAVKRETKVRNNGMDPKSEAFLQIAGERFAEVIDKTQVYDSVLSRSANMRSRSKYMNMLTSFMAEPTTSINMLEDALRKGDRKQIRRTVGAVYGSVLLNSLLVSLVYAARDDDEEKTFWEKYLSSVAVEVLDGINPITYYPFLRDIWSIGQGYDVERADMSLITDFRNAAKTVISTGQKLQEAEESEKVAVMEKFKDALWGMVDSVASLTGLPVKNIRRDIEGARNMFKTISKDLAGRETSDLSLQDAVLADVMNAIPIGNLLYSQSKRDRLYGAMIAGDTAYVQRLRAGYGSDSAYHSAIRTALRENDSRIWEAAVAWNNDDLETYKRIAMEIIDEKHFIQDDIVMAIRNEASSMEEKEGSSSSKVKGYFTNEKFGVAMGQNNIRMADTIQKDLVDTAMANGKSREEAESSVRSTARSQLKQLYADGTITDANAEKMLVKYGGYDQNEATDKVAEWKFEKEHGFAYSERGEAYKSGEITANELKEILMDVGGKTEEEADLQIEAYDWEIDGYDGATVAAVREYQEHCAAVLVPKNVYLYIRQFSNNTDNDVDEETGRTVYYSAMKRVIAEIDAQPGLTAAQKDAIARSLGWSEKNIKKHKTW